MVVAHQRSPQLIQRGRAAGLTLAVYSSEGDLVVTASGSTYSLYSPANVAVISGAAVTASGNVATYALADSTLDAQDYGSGWREEWALVIEGVTYNFVRPAAIVRRSFYATLIPGDLSALHTELPQITEFSVKIDNVLISTTWETWAWIKLDNAWSRIIRELWYDDRLPAAIEALSLDGLHEAITMELIYQDLRMTSLDRFADAGVYWGQKVEALKSRAVLKYDLDNDGVPDTEILGLGNRPRTIGGGWPGWQ